MLRSSLLRPSSGSNPASLLTRHVVRTTSQPSRASCLHPDRGLQHPQHQRKQQRCAHTHAVSNPTLANIEKRWEAMPPQEQADLWMQLRDRMKNPWSELTLQEKKAAYWIAFGPHGPRALPPPGENWKVFSYTMICVGVGFVLMWFARSVARPPPSTMNKEWQEQTNEYLKSQNTEPISGISSDGYVGPGQVQSKPKKKD
ncbi:MAG: Cytochrome c oxidase subunit 5A [Caeruleum heppii]|nr:MAG: Cytochrome c oxidase subunit 5A [Caeruleum heppii]